LHGALSQAMAAALFPSKRFVAFSKTSDKRTSRSDSSWLSLRLFLRRTIVRLGKWIARAIDSIGNRLVCWNCTSFW